MLVIREKQRFLSRISKYASDERIEGIFCARRKLANSCHPAAWTSPVIIIFSKIFTRGGSSCVQPVAQLRAHQKANPSSLGCKTFAYFPEWENCWYSVEKCCLKPRQRKRQSRLDPRTRIARRAPFHANLKQFFIWSIHRNNNRSLSQKINS